MLIMLIMFTLRWTTQIKQASCQSRNATSSLFAGSFISVTGINRLLGVSVSILVDSTLQLPRIIYFQYAVL